MVNSKFFRCISSNPHLFTTLTSLNSYIDFMLTSGAFTLPKALDKLVFLHHIFFLYYIPDFHLNLLLVSRIPKSLNCSIMFIAFSVSIYESWTEKVIVIENESHIDFLHHLNLVMWLNPLNFLYKFITTWSFQSI